MPLLRPIIRVIRDMIVQDIVRYTNYEFEETEILLEYVLPIDCAQNTDFLMYDYDADAFPLYHDIL